MALSNAQMKEDFGSKFSQYTSVAKKGYLLSACEEPRSVHCLQVILKVNIYIYLLRLRDSHVIF